MTDKARSGRKWGQGASVVPQQDYRFEHANARRLRVSG